MSIKIGFVLDPIEYLNVKKDSSIAMMRAAAHKGWQIYYWQAKEMYLSHDQARAMITPVSIKDDPVNWYEVGESYDAALCELDVVMMRKDPPFDMAYIHDTYLLDRAAAGGALVINPPSALRDCNEKLFTTWFADCMPPTLISRRAEHVRAFLAEHKDIIVKPPDGMGGSGIFRVQEGDPNISAILETLLPDAKHTIVAQRYIPEIDQGDKRILLIDGEPVPYGLARLPARGETRANLAVGGRGVAQPLTEKERWICEQVKPEIKARGLIFVGLDVIGGYLTEVNVTSPTCIREIDEAYDTDIGGLLMNAIEKRLEQ